MLLVHTHTHARNTLQRPGAVDERPIVKAACIKFIATFRNQFGKDELAGACGIMRCASTRCLVPRCVVLTLSVLQPHRNVVQLRVTTNAQSNAIPIQLDFFFVFIAQPCCLNSCRLLAPPPTSYTRTRPPQ